MEGDESDSTETTAATSDAPAAAAAAAAHHNHAHKPQANLYWAAGNGANMYAPCIDNVKSKPQPVVLVIVLFAIVARVVYRSICSGMSGRRYRNSFRSLTASRCGGPSARSMSTSTASNQV